MSKPTIGKRVDGRGPIHLDIESLIAGRLLIQASSGAGKSWALRRIHEQTHSKIQQISLDIEDEFHTLREKYDYVIAGRDGGDCPAEVKSAAMLARKLMEMGVSAIIGLYELKTHERQEFVKRFLESLISAPRRLWSPRLVFVDEVHVFAPQKGPAVAKEAVIDLAARGRKRGLVPIYATTRLAKVDKDVAAECANKLVGRCNLKDDAMRGAGELGMSGKEYTALMRLDPGHFFASGPALCPTVTEIVIGKVETTHPRPGQRAAPPTPPRSKVKKLLAQLADIPREAEAKAATEKEMRTEIRSLKAQLRSAAKAAPEPTVERVEVVPPELAELADSALIALTAGTEKIARELDIARDVVAGLMDNVALGALRPVHDALVRIVSEGGTLPAARKKANGARVTSVVVHRTKAAPKVNPATNTKRLLEVVENAEAATPSHRRLINALATLEAIGHEVATHQQIGFVAGYRISGRFHELRGELRKFGLVEYSGGGTKLTDAGRAIAEAPDAPLTTEGMHEMVFEMLTPSQRKLLDVLIAVYPNPLTNEQLGAETGYRLSGRFHELRGELKTLGLVEYPAGAQTVAASLLFLEDR